MSSRSILRPSVLVASAAFVVSVSGCSSERRSSARVGADSARRATSPTAPTKPSAPPATDTTHPATASDTVGASVAGVGAVQFGTTLDVAARAGGGTVAHAPGGSCGFVSFRALPHGVRFMVSYDTVVRADVDSATVATAAGARVGMTEDSVQHLYAGHLRVAPHKYVSGGHYLTSVPGAPADTLHRIIFETDGQRVTRYRAGLVPYVENVEGCG